MDGHNYPNLALMKISAWHKAQGDYVEWANPMFQHYDIVYKSKVFTFTPDNQDVYDCTIIKGGTGYDPTIKLSQVIDDMQPDYSIYNITNLSYGFLTRGCPNSCKWCIVPTKEGKVQPYRDIDQVAAGNKNVVLMDNNILASEYGINQLGKIAERGYKTDFNQGLDARLINDNTAHILSRIHWAKYIRLACDNAAQIGNVLRARQLLKKHGYDKGIFCYFLLDDWDDCNARLAVLRPYKDIILFAQPYRDYYGRNKIPQWQKDMARWINRRWLYMSCNFEDFRPRKNFKCSYYYAIH